MMNYRTALLAGTAATLAVSFGGLANAQQAEQAQPSAGAATLEEVVVTARKREESLQTVPVAVTTQSGAQLERQRITEPTGLGRITPSLQIRPGAGSANSAAIALRGQAASDTLLGISQPVGLYEDSVNIPHPFGANNSFVDVSRVEVLKGPQGTLYGRNTTGGAINVITRGADYDGVHGFIEGELGNFSSRRVVGAVNAPIVPDVLAVRLAYQYWKKDGFGKSKITGQDFGDEHDDQLARLSVRFDPLPNLSANLKIEYGKADKNGAMLASRSLANAADLPAAAAASATTLRTYTLASAALWSNYRTYAPLLRNGLFLGNLANLGQVLAAGQGVLAGCIGGSIYENCSATHQFDNLKTWHGALDVNWDITDTVQLRSITGMHKFNNRKVFDLDSVQPQILEVGYGSDGLAVAPAVANYVLPYHLPEDQESTQWSQEFNLSGKFLDGKLDWLLGVFGSWDKGSGSQNAGALEEFTAFASQLSPDFQVLGDPLDDGNIGSPTLFNHLGAKNTTDTWAVFTQNDIHITDRVSVTVGARYTEERIGQDLADYDIVLATGAYVCHGVQADGLTKINYAPPIPTDPSSCMTSVYSRGPNSLFSRGTFSGTSYLLSFNYQITPDKLFYAKTSRGFRGGAFGRAAQVVAAPEFATDYEVGFKGDWLDRRLRTNVAVYQTNYDNKQVSSLTCNGGIAPPCGAAGFTTTLRNAATARIRGFEAEFQAVPMEGLSAYGNISYTDATFTRWANAVSGDGAPIGDADGLDIASTPDWQGNLGARYERAVGPGVMGVQVDYSYRGKIAITPLNNQLLVPDALEKDMQSSVGLVNARLEYKMEEMGLTVSVWGANLTDEEYGYEGISAGYTGGISHMVVESPRTYGVTVRKTFGGE